MESQEWLNCLDGIAYLTDTSGVIVAVGERNWSHFARENGAPALGSPVAAIGCNVLGLTHGEAVRFFYTRALSALHSGKAGAISFSFRSDAPRLRRDMRMAITPWRHHGQIEGFLFQTTLFNESMLATRARLDDQPMAPAGIMVCSICQRVCLLTSNGAPTGDWLDPEYRTTDTFLAAFPVEHTICPSCCTKFDPQSVVLVGGLRLAPRQFAVLRLVAQGHPNKMIARRMGTSQNTVKTHLKYIFKRLGARNRTDAARRSPCALGPS